MFRRVPMHAVADLDELEELIAAVAHPIVVIFDADNTLVPQGVTVDAFSRDVTAVIERFEAQPSVARVIVLTNGPDRGVPRMIHRGNKPWTTRRRLGLDRTHRGACVVGDQVLTDGVLAWRLGAAFVLLAIDVNTETPRQAAMRRVGSALTPLLFRRRRGLA